MGVFWGEGVVEHFYLYRYKIDTVKLHIECKSDVQSNIPNPHKEVYAYQTTFYKQGESMY